MSKPNGIVLIPLLIMIGAVVAFGVMAYVVIQGYRTTNTNSATTNTTNTAVVTNQNTNLNTNTSVGVNTNSTANTNAAVNVNVGNENTNVSANTNSNSATTSTTEAVGANAKRYTSPALGISFIVGNTYGERSVKIQETSDTIYVYMDGTEPTSGQFVRKFTKASGDNLKTAVEKQFLNGYKATDCYVVPTSVYGGMAAGWEAVQITFPKDLTAENPWANADKCPGTYTTTNGASYFVMNTAQTTSFYYLSIGQYSIPSNTANKGWETTLLPVAASASVPSGWKTYTNATRGYSIQYPANWGTTDQFGQDSIQLLPPGVSKDFVGENELAGAITLRWNDTNYQYYTDLTDIIINRQSAKQGQYMGVVRYVGTFFMHNTDRLGIEWDERSETSTYRDILSTFQFTQ